MKRKTLALLIFTASIFAATFFAGNIYIHRVNNSLLTVSFLDVGQGDAILIESPTGRRVLIDSGSGRIILSALSPTLPFFDKTIDLLIATHPDKDHIGGFSFVMERFKTKMLCETDIESSSGVDDYMREFRDKNNIEECHLHAGDEIDVGGGAILRIFAPFANMNSGETNEHSIVARLSYGDQSFLLTGDAPKDVEVRLTQKYGNALKSTVLKLGHHGSHTSTSPIFLFYVKPSVAIISAGKNNSYGHPHQDVLERLVQFLIPARSTIERGTITFVTNGKTIEEK